MAKKSGMNTVLGLGAVALGAAYVYWQNYSVGTTDYFVENPRFDHSLNGFTIAHLSDLHLPDQKVDLNDIVEQVYQIQPNIIALTGDIVETDATGLDEGELYSFFSALVEIAPTFAIFGNHDAVSLQHNLLTAAMSNAGVVHLNDRALTYTYRDQPITLIGLDDKANKHFLTGDALRHVSLTAEQKLQPKILLAHHPEAFLRYHEDIDKSPDLVLSGHAHGGQIRLPFIGGLFAPNQGQFPKYTSGVFYLPGNPAKQMVVSRGIGASTFPIRLNNRPEVVAVHLTTDIESAVAGLEKSIDYVTEQEGGVTADQVKADYLDRKANRAQEQGYYQVPVAANTADEILSEIDAAETGETTSGLTQVEAQEFDDDVVDRSSIDLPKYEADEDVKKRPSAIRESYIIMDEATKQKEIVDQDVDAEKIFSDNLNEDLFIVEDPTKKNRE